MTNNADAVIARPLSWIRKQAASKPIGYWKEREFKRLSSSTDLIWSYLLHDDSAIEREFAKFAVSEADPYRERISGCCDRADQY